MDGVLSQEEISALLSEGTGAETVFCEGQSTP